MKVLLDTCTLIWLCSDSDKFSSRAKSVFGDSENAALYLSDVSVFEIALKCSQGKMELPESPREWIAHQLEIWGIQSLPISQNEIFASADLPWHHKDPFDRLLIIQSRIEKAPVISCDKEFLRYDVDVIW